MSRPQIEAWYREERELAENTHGDLAEHSAIRARVLKRVLDGGRV